MFKTVIIGNYGANNLGDEAILHAILFSHPKIEFTVFSNTPEKTTQTHFVKSVYPLPFGIRSFFRGNFFRTFQTLKNTDCVIIGGGALFTDEKMKAILLWGWHFMWAKFLHKPVFFYANTFGPLRSDLAQLIVRKILEKADFISIRDQESAQILEKLGIKNYQITADPAFLIQREEKKENLKNKKVAISLRNWIENEKKYIEALKPIIKILEEQGYQVLLIPMQTFQDDDRTILTQIASPKSIIVIPQNFQELIQLLQSCEFTIGMRLHFLIASTIAQTPFITLSYSNKTTSLAQEVGLGEFCLELKDVSTNLILEKIYQLKNIKNSLDEVQKVKMGKAELNKKFFEDFVHSKTK